MAKNRNGPNRKYGKRIELRTEQNESNKTETAVYRFSPTSLHSRYVCRILLSTIKQAAMIRTRFRQNSIAIISTVLIFLLWFVEILVTKIMLFPIITILFYVGNTRRQEVKRNERYFEKS